MFTRLSLDAQRNRLWDRVHSLSLPTASRAQLILVSQVLISLYVLLVVVSCLGSQAGYYDESIPLLQGRMVAEGHTPHVDFWSFYPPLNYYLNAAAFFVFGRTILAQRLLQAGLYLLLLILANRFLRRQFANAPLLVEGTTFLLAVAIGPPFLLPAFVGFSISFYALLAYLSVYGAPLSHVRPRVAAAGLLNGLALTSRFNFGAYAVAVILLDLLLVRLVMSKSATFGQARVLRSWFTVATFALSTFVSWIAIYLLLCGPNLATAIEQSIIFPQQEVMGLRFVPLPFTSGLVLAVLFPCSWFSLRLIIGRDQIPKRTVVPLAFAFVVLVIAWFQGTTPVVARDVTIAELAFVLFLHIFVYRLERAEISLLLFFACLLHYYLSRADDWHWPLLLPVAALLIPYLLLPPAVTQRSSVPYARRGSTVAWYALLIVLLCCVPELKPAHLRNGLNLIVHGGLSRRLTDSQRILGSATPPKPWLSIYPDLDELKALRFVRVRTSVNDPIFHLSAAT